MELSVAEVYRGIDPLMEVAAVQDGTWNFENQTRRKSTSVFGYDQCDQIFSP